MSAYVPYQFISKHSLSLKECTFNLPELGSEEIALLDLYIRTVYLMITNVNSNFNSYVIFNLRIILR
jgi:hypothetical protein